jgi:DNA replication protein DnaC
MSAGRTLREHLNQLAPKSPEQITLVDSERINKIKTVELTKEEHEAAIFRAKSEKLELIELEEKKKQYWNTLVNPPVAPRYTAEQLRARLLQSKTAGGKYFQIDNENKAQVDQICMYFAGDGRFELHGDFSLSKGLLLMGGLGVGKTHLMSFFINNQVQSYVMLRCSDVERKWLEASKEDKDYIDYYSSDIASAVNANPYNHEVLGICFDDLGRETVPSKRFGEEKNVMSEILLNRYDRKHAFNKTHLTTNLNEEGIISLYGDRLLDRMVEMFNVIVFEGKSRRS